jgi:hypothetical protein
MLHELRAATVRHAQEFTYQEPGWVERNNAAAAEVRAIEARILASQSSPRAHAATPDLDAIRSAMFSDEEENTIILYGLRKLLLPRSARSPEREDGT